MPLPYSANNKYHITPHHCHLVLGKRICMFFCFSALYVFTMFSQCSHRPSYLDHSSNHALTNLQRSHGRDDRIYGRLPFLSQLKHESLFSIFISPSRPSTNTEFMSNLCLLGLRDASTLDCLECLFCICCASPHAKKGPICQVYRRYSYSGDRIPVVVKLFFFLFN